MNIRSSQQTRTAMAVLRPLAPFALGAFVTACGPSPITLDQGEPRLQIYFHDWTTVPVVEDRGGVIPDLGQLTPLSASGAFTYAGDLATGTATLSAVVVDVTTDGPPDAFGTGSFDVPVDGVDYARSGALAMAAVLPDDTDTLLLGAYTMEVDAAGSDLGTVVYIAVPRAAAVTGGSVELDGEASIAVFGWGPLDRETPELTAVAISGTVTFGAVDLSIGGVVEASLVGEFGRAEFDEVVPRDPPIDSPAPTFAEGAYELSILGGADARCEGTLLGRQSELSALGASAYGLSGGAVDARGTPDALTFSGTAIEISFATPSVDASWQGDIGAFTVFTESAAPGVLGLLEEGRYLLTSGPDGEGMIGVVVSDATDPSGGSFCQVAFPALLHAL